MEDIIKADPPRGRNATYWIDDATRERLAELATHYKASKSSTLKQLISFAHKNMTEKLNATR